MKIQDLIKLEKGNSKEIKTNYGTSYFYENGIQLKFEKKHGYYWKIPTHSQNESVLLNNYEKDCVIAYIENKYLVMFLIKISGKDNHKCFVYLKDFLSKVTSNQYRIEKIWDTKKILWAFEEDIENLKIVNEEEYSRFKKLMILEGVS